MSIPHARIVLIGQIVLLATFARASATARPDPACKAQCAADHTSCVTTAAQDFALLTAGCPESGRARRRCVHQARAAHGRARANCTRLRKRVCLPCCRTGGQTCSGLPMTTTIRVHYPAGTHTIALRGSIAPFSEDRGRPLTLGPDDTWTLVTTTLTAPMEWKPLLDDTTASRGPSYTVSPNQTVDVYPHFTTTKGRYERAYDFQSTILGNTRGIWIYQPPTYLENARARMPVVYMHDGQNLFDPQAAFGGNEWMVDEAMDAAAENGSIAEALVVGVESTSDRTNEYTPTLDATQGTGGKGDLYLRMLVEELKPRVDAELRTLPDRAHTAMVGSSLGGLISAYGGVTKADTFALIGAMSPSTFWDNRVIIADVGGIPSRASRALEVYLDSGDAGPSNDDVTNTADLAAAYRAVGYADGSTLRYVVQPGGQHNEIYWAQRLPGALAFLLGPRQ